MGRIVINIKGRAIPHCKAMEVRIQYSWSRDLEEERKDGGRER